MSCVKSQLFKIDEFAKLVHPRDGHLKIFAMIEAYLDESGIHQGAAYCTIAGYFGQQAAMRRLEREWKNVLKRYQFDMADFHAKDLVKSPKHGQMIKDLSRAIASCRSIYPVNFGIVVEDFNSFNLEQKKFFTGATFRRGKLVTTGCPSKPYFVPFQMCCGRITQHTPSDARAHFFFGLDRNFYEYAAALFKQAKISDSPSDFLVKARLGDAVFPLAKETPQLQAADLLVHLSYIHMLENIERTDWPVAPTGNLRLCMKNQQHINDAGFQTKEHLINTLEKLKARNGGTLPGSMDYTASV